MRDVKLLGTGAYLPGEPVAFQDVDEALGPLPDMPKDFTRWYKRSRRLMGKLLGMEYFHYALDPVTREPAETCASLGAKAAREALDMAGLEPGDVDLLVYASSSLDRFICPPTSTLLQEELGIPNCAEYTIHSNCTAPYKGLQLASELLGSGRYKTALVVSSNLVSNALKGPYFNPEKLERNAAMLRFFLSDGAGAMVLGAGERGVGPGTYIVDTFLESVGAGSPSHMYSRAGASTAGPKQDYEDGLHHIVQDFSSVSTIGPELFSQGFDRMIEQIRSKKGQDHFEARAKDVSHCLINVPSRHLIDLVADEMNKKFMPHLGGKLPFDLYFTTIDKLGYTGPAAMPITLDKVMRGGELTPGNLILSFVTESSKWMNAGFMFEVFGETPEGGAWA